MKTLDDLNARFIATDGYDVPLQDYSTRDSAEVDVIFRNLEGRLVEMIRQADAIFGCVAWLTNKRILDALATKKDNVSIVVQKEDFLRPDLHARKTDWKNELRQKYNNLGMVTRYWLPGIAASLSLGGDSTCEAVRCVGNHNSEKQSAFPRMHNKFLVFCASEEESTRYNYNTYNSYAVWTGSFNLTFNASMSLENAVVIRSHAIAQAYLNEWAQTLALSEPLDWEKEWI